EHPLADVAGEKGQVPEAPAADDPDLSLGHTGLAGDDAAGRARSRIAGKRTAQSVERFVDVRLRIVHEFLHGLLLLRMLCADITGARDARVVTQFVRGCDKNSLERACPQSLRSSYPRVPNFLSHSCPHPIPI